MVRPCPSSHTSRLLTLNHTYRMDLTTKQRKAYIDAVLCMQSKPALTTQQAPGARSRYDDFVVIHVQQALQIHATTAFLPWHRYFVWAYENALRTECGYKGYQPVILSHHASYCWFSSSGMLC